MAENRMIPLDGLSLEDIQKVEPKITSAVMDVLNVESSARSRTSYGGTAPDRVREQIKRWRDLV